MTARAGTASPENKGLSFTIEGGERVELQEGDTVDITKPWPVKRAWWQFWRPRWVEGPVETKSYTIGKTITSDRLQERLAEAVYGMAPRDD